MLNALRSFVAEYAPATHGPLIPALDRAAASGGENADMAAAVRAVFEDHRFVGHGQFCRVCGRKRLLCESR